MALPLPIPLKIYARAAALLAPLAPKLLEKRARRGKENRARMQERLGVPSLARPDGKLIWLHGASVGETISTLPLVEQLTQRGYSVLVTSGTVTSAAVMEKRLPAGAVHQFVPLDAPPFVNQFLEHWRPDAALIAESEIWPNLIIGAHDRHNPVMIVNGRMSERSFQRWQKRPAIIRALLSRMDLCLAQSRDDAFRFGALGAPNVQMPGNLKFDGPPPPVDAQALAILSGAFAGRPLWLAASTHRGEEDIVLDAHKQIAGTLENVVTVIVPRHPERGAEVAALATDKGLRVARRSAGEPPAGAAIYIADTIGEMGLFYRLAPLVFMGGSLIPHGGQNPIEPAKLGAAILHGPHVFNFSEAIALLDQHKGSRQVSSGDLAQTVLNLLADPEAMHAMGQAGCNVMAQQSGATARTVDAVLQAMQSKNQRAGQ